MKQKQRFFNIGQYVFYVLDNRNGHIAEAERTMMILDVSYIKRDDLRKMTEAELFNAAEDTTPLVTADQL